MELTITEKSRIFKSVLTLLIIVSAFFAVKIISEIKNYRFIGGGIAASNTIVFDGHGGVSAIPDLATISFTIRESASNVKDAQAKATTKETVALAFLEKTGVAKKDVKTESYNSYPKYNQVSPCYPGIGIPCNTDSPTIVGYEVSEYVSVKVRDLTKAGDIVKGIGAVGISEISGPNFSIENEDSLKEQARKMAIDEAKNKARSLAGDLGVRLVRIVNFSENGNYPRYSKEFLLADSVSSGATPAPALPTGENKITSNVTITYEIR